ncbi:ABC transporter substrate-binding protein [Nitrospira sp. Kam-Ns4a]
MPAVRLAIQRLALGALLVALLATALLVAHQSRRPLPSQPQPAPRVALVQHSSLPLLDEGVKGIIEGLAEAGYIEGQSLALARFDAENDLALADQIAQQVTSGSYDLVVTVSTRSLQAVAAANEGGRTRHVFGLVSDPFAAGVGINPENPLDHPRHLVGYGTMPPIEDAFRLAKTLYPALASVGVIWNPADADSAALVRMAREVSHQLGIVLVERQVDRPAAAAEAAAALLAKPVQALWVGGDLTVLLALDAVLEAARRARVPVFTNVPLSAERGALFDIGADYREVGRRTGLLASELLQGVNPATVAVQNLVPKKTVINLVALANLKDPWMVDEEVLHAAHEVIDETGVHRGAALVARPPPGRIFRVGVVYFGPDPVVDSGLQGLFDGLRELGFVEGENLEVRRAHAQGEMANIPAILKSYIAGDLDLIVTLTTPCLAAAVNLVKKTPVVFAVVYDPIAAGAGTSRTEHLPNITGVGSFPPVEETVELIRTLVPQVKAVGTLYNAAEANSRKVVGVARELFKQRGIALQEVAIAKTGEVFQAAQMLATRNIDAFWITGDNTALQAYETITRVADQTRIPLVINQPEFIERGGLACVGQGFYKSGYVAATLAARVLMGESPKSLPFEEVSDKKVCLNFEAAQQLGIAFPAELVERSRVFVHLAAWYGRSARIALVETAGESEDFQTGLLKGLAEAGLVGDSDFVLRRYVVTGPHSTWRETLADVRAGDPDVVVVAQERVGAAVRQAVPGKPVLGPARELAADERAAGAARLAVAVAQALAGKTRAL